MSQNIAVVLKAFGEPEKLQRRIMDMIELADDPMSVHFFMDLNAEDPRLKDFSLIKYETNVHREYIVGSNLKQIVAGLVAQKYSIIIWGDVSDPLDVFKHWDTSLRERFKR